MLKFRKLRKNKRQFGEHTEYRYTFRNHLQGYLSIDYTDEGYPAIPFKSVLAPARKIAVLIGIANEKSPSGWHYFMEAYPVTEKQSDMYRREGYLRAASFQEAEEKAKDQAGKYLIACLETEALRCAKDAEDLRQAIEETEV